MTNDRPAALLALAQDIAAQIPDFQAVRRAGAGDRATTEFMRRLRERANEAFGADFSERRICGDTAFAVDFYFPEESTIVEVALGLPNPGSEFEKDVLKAVIAQDFGIFVRRLFFISRAGAVKKCSQPGRIAVKEWARTKHNLHIEIHELPGEPRVRCRSRTAR